MTDPAPAASTPAGILDRAASQPWLIRVIAAGILGAVAGSAAIYGVHASSPAFVTTLANTPTPAIARGLHPTEFEADGLAFAWTGDRVLLIFEGLDRSRTWTLVLRAKAGRGPGLPLPTATVAVDGAARASAPIGPQWQEIRTAIPTDTRQRPRCW